MRPRLKVSQLACSRDQEQAARLDTTVRARQIREPIQVLAGVRAPAANYQMPPIHFAPSAVAQITTNVIVSTIAAANIAIARSSPSSSR